MQKIHISTTINAPKEKVWDIMLQDETYREWTKAFKLGSYYVGDWSEGSEMQFLGPGDEGVGESGLFSIVRENSLYEFISVEHLGFIQDGVKDDKSEEVKKWTPSFENYTFVTKDEGTELIIDMDIHEDYKDMFEDMWHKALENIKHLAETQSLW